ANEDTSLSNYSVATSASGAGTITPKELAVTGVIAGNKVYDATTAATVSGGSVSPLGNDQVILSSAANATFADKNAGTGKAVTTAYTLSGTGASNYTLVQPTNLTADITPATLTYVAQPVTITAGSPIPTLSGTVTGFVAGEAMQNATTGNLLFSTSATGASQFGLYPILGSGLTANDGNYVFAQAPANGTAFTVNQAAIQPSPPPAPIVVPAFIDNGAEVLAANTTPNTFGGLNYVQAAGSQVPGTGSAQPSSGSSTLNFVSSSAGDVVTSNSTGTQQGGTTATASTGNTGTEQTISGASTLNFVSSSAGDVVASGSTGTQQDGTTATVTTGNTGTEQPTAGASTPNFVSSSAGDVVASDSNTAGQDSTTSSQVASGEGGKRKSSSELNVNNVTVPSSTGPLDVFVIDTGINYRGIATLQSISN
ncbi:MAG: hypothetical protein HYZ18_04810, partial [Pseudogulbenkiania sp.]|nr:hypothetical protein [Pseudogulbenkiania sp.]